jgi:hypothetical protein
MSVHQRFPPQYPLGRRKIFLLKSFALVLDARKNASITVLLSRKRNALRQSREKQIPLLLAFLLQTNYLFGF